MTRRLEWEIAAVLAVKLVLLAVLFSMFFSNPVADDHARVFAHVVGGS